MALLIICARRMRPVFTTVFLILCLGFAAPSLAEQAKEMDTRELIVEAGEYKMDLKTGLMTFPNGTVLRSGDAVLKADQATVNKDTGEVLASGNVRIQNAGMVWIGDHVRYNFKTGQMLTDKFRAGSPPIFAGGEALTGSNIGNPTNQVYTATNAFITLDDYSNPLLTVRARRLKIVPGEKFSARGTTLRLGPVPFFYLPHFSQDISLGGGVSKPAFTMTPGYRSRFGATLRGAYNTKLTESVDAKLHVDYRSERGPGIGPDLNFHLGDWGDATFKYYYLYDRDPETNSFNSNFPHNRQRAEFNWLASPSTNTTFKSRASFQTDEGVRREFFEGEYRNNVQPGTFVEARHAWENFSLSIIASPRLNTFFETVERLPELKLTGFRQQLGASPLFYESESRVGFLRRRFAETNSPSGADFETTRADSYQQVVLPMNAFGWLNFTPRVGGRFTTYGSSDGPGANTQQINRAILNTGGEISTKASRTWAGVRHGMFDLDGLRHIVEPSANFVYVPKPDARPGEIPQFDSEIASLHLLPIEMPDYNAIDSVDSQNVVRIGLRNRLQTKRDGQLEDWLDWNVFSDLRLSRAAGQNTFSDVWSDLKFRPRSWLSFNSLVRYEPHAGSLRMAFNSILLTPNNTWHWRLGHFYLRDDFSASPTAWGAGNDLVTSTLYYKVNENWGLRASHYFDVREGELREQTYTVYRDLRSWTSALSFRIRNNTAIENDFAVVFTFSIKAIPRFDHGEDGIGRDAFLNY